MAEEGNGSDLTQPDQNVDGLAEYRGVLIGNPPDKIITSMGNVLDGLRAGLVVKGVEGASATLRDVADGDAYRTAAEMVIAEAEGKVEDDMLRVVLGDEEKRKMVTDLAGDINLYMDDEPIQNQALARQTQKAESVAQQLKGNGVDNKKWQSALGGFKEKLNSF